MWTREPDILRGETWAYDSQGKRFRTKLKLPETNSGEQAKSTRGEVAVVVASKNNNGLPFETSASKASAPVGNSGSDVSEQVEDEG
jgi:hypothetical protein